MLTTQNLRRFRMQLYYGCGLIRLELENIGSRYFLFLLPLTFQYSHAISFFSKKVDTRNGKENRVTITPSSTSQSDLSHPWEPRAAQGPRAQVRTLQRCSQH